MARTRKKALATEAPATIATLPERDVFDQAIADRQQQAAAIVQQVADATRLPDGIVHGPSDGSHMPAPEREAAHENGHAARFTPNAGTMSRKEYPKAPNPFGVEGISAGGNRVRLLKEEPNRQKGFPGAWVIRFDKNPNEGVDADGKPYGKDNPHPVLAYLKSEGHRWGFADGDEKGGWGKLWDEGHYKYEEHMRARDVLAKAAEILGAGRGNGVA